MSKSENAAHHPEPSKFLRPTTGFFIPHERVPAKVGDTSQRAKQSFKEECDINNILARARETGTVTHVNERPGQYMELPDNLTFHESLNAVIRAQEAFEDLPSEIRRRFGNDPALFLDFVHDEENYDEMVELGLVYREVEPSPPAGGDNAPLGDGMRPEGQNIAPETPSNG